MNILVTGFRGFIGKNLIVHIQRRADSEVVGFTRGNTTAELDAWLEEADFVYHLAGVNRPENEEDFFRGNAELTTHICQQLARRADPPPILFASSIQAELDNPYGQSKRLAEEALINYAEETGGRAIIYRLENVFGKWSRPNYNTVVATFCHNIAHDLPISISNPNRELELVHIDDVIRHFIAELDEPWAGGVVWRHVLPVFRVTVGRLAEIIRSLRSMRNTLHTPDFADPFIRKLYGMYLTYLDENDLAYSLTQHSDERGCLAEFIKSQHFGQLFVSRTRPGITRGNHFHHTKAEKFLVLEGEAIIRFRPIQGSENSDQGVIEYRVSGKDFRVLDIPPGYTHNIENVGDSNLITLFWASEIFDKEAPDTYYEQVQAKSRSLAGK